LSFKEKWVGLIDLRRFFLAGLFVGLEKEIIGILHFTLFALASALGVDNGLLGEIAVRERKPGE
jgi:hypothetical protein